MGWCRNQRSNLPSFARAQLLCLLQWLVAQNTFRAALAKIMNVKVSGDLQTSKVHPFFLWRATDLKFNFPVDNLSAMKKSAPEFFIATSVFLAPPSWGPRLIARQRFEFLCLTVAEGGRKLHRLLKIPGNTVHISFWKRFLNKKSGFGPVHRTVLHPHNITTIDFNSL